MSAVIEEATQKIESRLQELEPLVEEFQELKRFKEQFSGSTEMAVTVEGKTSGNAPRGQTAKAVAKLVQNHPEGMKVADIAQELGRADKISYMYVVVQRLVKDGVARRVGSKIYPAQASE